MDAVDVRGRFVWHELMTRDVPGAKNFYTKLLGWKAMPWPLSPAYTICHAGVGPVAGIMEMPGEAPADAPSSWLLYLGTRDVDGAADAAVRAGGSVMKAPADMQGAGRYAVLKDPQGALFAIIDPENARPETESAPATGTFAWHELATTDHEAAFAFYSQLFGWDVMQRMDMGPAGTYLIFGWKGVQRGGMYLKPAGWQAPPNWLPYVSVASADDSFAQATASGAAQMIAPMEVPGGGRIATITDPVGAAFALYSSPAAEASTAASTSRPKAKAKSKGKPKAKTKAKATRKPVRKPAPRKKVAKKKAATKRAKGPAAKASRKSRQNVARKRSRKSAPRKSRQKPKTSRRKK